MGAMTFLKDVDAAFHLMRQDIVVPSSDDDIEGYAVKQYLVYLSMLVDVVFSGLAMNAVHGNDTLVLILQRVMVEYAAKALYYWKHPAFAVFMVIINEADSVVSRATDGGMSAERVAEFRAHASEVRARFPAYANIPGVSVRQMIEEVARTEEWAWLYGAPSVLLHGEPEGMRTMFELTDGERRGRIDLDDGYLNAHMVDAGTNVLTFCRAFNVAFHPDDATIATRFEALEERGRKLILRLSEGRDPDAMDDLRKGGS